jgi:hypothetical protein
VSVKNLEKAGKGKITNVKLTFHDVIKPMNLMNMKADRFNKIIKDKIQSKI